MSDFFLNFGLINDYDIRWKYYKITEKKAQNVLYFVCPHLVNGSNTFFSPRNNSVASSYIFFVNSVL